MRSLLALALLLLAAPALAGTRVVYGSIAGSPSSATILHEAPDGTLVEDAPVWRYSAPRWDGRADNGAWVGFGRLQSVDVSVSHILGVTTRFENLEPWPADFWQIRQGANTYFSRLGGVGAFGNDFPMEISYAGKLAAFDGATDFAGPSGYSYGSGGGAWWVSSTDWIDPQNRAQMRGWCGVGNVTVESRPTSRMHGTSSAGHWRQGGATTLTPWPLGYDGVMPPGVWWIKVVYHYADSGDVVYRSRASAWADAGWTNTDRFEDTQGAEVGSIPWAGAGEPILVADLAGPAWDPYSVVGTTLRVWQAHDVLSGIENVSPVAGVCGGGGYEFLRWWDGAQQTTGVGMTFNLGSSFVALPAFDGACDFAGASGTENWTGYSGATIPSYEVPSYGSAPYAGPLQIAVWRASMQATFVSQTSGVPFAWWLRTCLGARFQRVDRSL